MIILTIYKYVPLVSFDILLLLMKFINFIIKKEASEKMPLESNIMKLIYPVFSQDLLPVCL